MRLSKAKLVDEIERLEAAMAGESVMDAVNRVDLALIARTPKDMAALAVARSIASTLDAKFWEGGSRAQEAKHLKTLLEGLTIAAVEVDPVEEFRRRADAKADRSD